MKKRQLRNVFSSLENARNRKGLLPLNIQLFADGDDDGNDKEKDPNNKDNDDKTDWKALYEKMKNEKDKASKEASEFKKQLKAKETDEEKKAREDKERQEEIDKILLENKTYRLANELSKGDTFTSDEVQKIVEARQNEDDTAFATALNEIIKAKLEAQKTQLMKEFKRNPNIPGGSNDGGSGSDSATELAKRLGSNNKTPSKERFGSYFGK